MAATDRGAMMLKFADLIEEHREDLATLETWDNGKPYTVARDEDLGEVINTIRFYAGYADKIYGQTISSTPEKFAYTLKQPIGVCGQIIPWNYPLAMAAWKSGSKQDKTFLLCCEESLDRPPVSLYNDCELLYMRVCCPPLSVIVNRPFLMSCSGRRVSSLPCL